MTRREILKASLGVISVSGLASVSVAAVDRDGATHVSLIRLIANPKDFDGRRLRLTGCLGSLGLDMGVGLYPSDVDVRNYIDCNAIALRLNSKEAGKFRGKYVMLVGTYHAPKPDAVFCDNGEIENIVKLEAWKFGDQ